MKILFFLLILTSISLQSFPQINELTNEECQSKIEYHWKSNSYKKAVKNVSQICLSNPNNSVSLRNMYYLRQEIPKKKLKVALNKLTDENKLNDYAKSLEIFTRNKQVQKGDQYYDFKATSNKNEEIVFSNIAKGKDILLIFDGLDCIGKEAREYLIDLYHKLDKNKVEIISFFYVSNNEELTKKVNEYDINWIGISDFKNDHSIIKIIYDAQARPTSVYINSQGKVLVNQPGIRQKTVNMLEKYIIE